MPPSLRDSRTLSLLRALHRAMRAVDAADEAGIAAYGLQHSEFDVVMTLGNTSGLRMSDLAARMLASPPNVTRIVKRLESLGLVRRDRGERSDREVIARLTPEGERLFARAYPAQYEHMNAFFSGRLTDRQQDALAELLRKLGADPSAVPAP